MVFRPSSGAIASSGPLQVRRAPSDNPITQTSAAARHAAANRSPSGSPGAKTAP